MALPLKSWHLATILLLCSGAWSSVRGDLAPPRLDFEQHASHPLALNATYRGTWRKRLPYGQDPTLLRLLGKDEGVAVYVLKIVRTTDDGVSDVEVWGNLNGMTAGWCWYLLKTLKMKLFTTSCALQGEVVLRDGAYVTADDMLFRLEGVYVAATGRLHAVLHTTQPLYTTVDTHDIEERSLQYRWVCMGGCFQNCQLPVVRLFCVFVHMPCCSTTHHLYTSQTSAAHPGW